MKSVGSRDNAKQRMTEGEEEEEEEVCDNNGRIVLIAYTRQEG